jgi:UDP-N-acetylglucosamine 2-epimerase (non-hydrolysing)
MKILSVVGARPNFMKIAPIVRTIAARKDLRHILVHTGQHYDEKMSTSFFRQLGIPRPHINLEVGSGSHATQTAEIMKRFEPICQSKKPDVILLVGDVNSTLACAIVAKKLWIPVAHVEAGLRSGDRRMPEEINRIVTDSISDIFFTTSPEARVHLQSEGIPASRIHYVGNVMIDSLLANMPKASISRIGHQLKIIKKNYGLVTLHRPSNVDSREALMRIMTALSKIQKKIPVIFPVHPRTMKNIKTFMSEKELSALPHIQFLEPQGYHDFLNLMMNAKFVITDSGGIQEETTVLGIPCLTARDNTERPITISEGTNILVGTKTNKIVHEVMSIIQGNNKPGKRPRFWDGKSAERIVTILQKLHQTGKLER